MAFDAQVLANLQAPATKGDLYDPGTDNAQVHNILLHNANTTPENVEIYLYDGTNEYKHWNVALAANETLQISFPGEGLPVDASSKITGSTDTAAKVTVTVMGSVVT